MSSAESLPAEQRQRDNGYRVGSGCPPREYQFKPGASGNPDGPPVQPLAVAWAMDYEEIGILGKISDIVVSAALPQS